MPSCNPHCMVDHPDNVADLGLFFAARGLRLNVMIEYGVVGGRCGCRSEQEVRELAKAIKAQPALALTGIEGYEGVIHGEHAVSGIRDFAASLVRLAVDLQNNGAFDLPKPIITASGSAWYDLIAESFETQNAAGRFLSVLRPGSYVAHDHGTYKQAQCCVRARLPLNPTRITNRNRTPRNIGLPPETRFTRLTDRATFSWIRNPALATSGRLGGFWGGWFWGRRRRRGWGWGFLD